jgi:hypothetical protein
VSNRGLMRFMLYEGALNADLFIRAGSVCLNRFSGLLGGAPAGFRLPRSAAAD